MADIAINPVSRRVQFTGNTGTGPFAFTFNILADEDITVYKNTTLLTLTTDYTVATNADGTGSVTLVAALVASDVLTIIGGRELERTTDFVTAGDLLAESLNEQLDSLVIMAQQLDEKMTRSFKVNPGDQFTDLEMPLLDDRKGKYLAFNATTGDPEAGPDQTDVVTLSAITSDIATLADIEDGTDATDAIQTVAGISSNVSTVAGISSNVTTVAGISSDVTTVAGISSDVDDLGAVATEIGQISGYITEINTIGDDLNSGSFSAGTEYDFGLITDASSGQSGSPDGFIVTVYNNLSDINALGSISANVTTVAGISSDVSAVAADATDIGTVATNITSVNTVATNIADVITVANDLNEAVSEVVTVADDLNEAVSEIDTVANSISNVNAVGASIANVNTVAGITANIATVAGNSANVTTVAGISSNVTTVATNSANITTVAGISSDVTTVAGDSADIQTVATNLSSINDFADKYRIGATDPTTGLDEGDLFYNTTSDTLKVYNGTAWEAGVTAGSGFMPLSGGTFNGAVTFAAGQTFDGRDVSADGTKLDGIEANATADQTGAEIKTAYEAEADTNAFTDAEKTKLSGIESGADVTDTTNVVAALTAGTNVTIAADGTISSSFTDTNTTYSAGTGMSLSGTTFNCTIDSPSEVGLGNLSNNGNNLSGSFTATGNITAYSDERLKDNVTTINNALNKVSVIRGVTYNRNDIEDAPRHAGVIAQEVEKVLPEVIQTDGNGIKSVAYGNMVGLLIEAIKELKAEIEELKNGSTD